MCIYCNTDNYRKIYEHHHGPIPREEDGRTYEIHHKDGNHSNNDPENLMAVTLLEHYDIHYSQGDYNACRLMASQRMDKTPQEISELARLNALKQIENGTNALVGGKIQKETAKKRMEEGTHHFIGDSNPGGEASRERVKNGTHNLLGPEMNQKRIGDGTHNLLGDRNPSRIAVKNGTHHFQRKGKENHSYKKETFIFSHKTGLIFEGTRSEFHSKYPDTNLCNISLMIHGKQSSHKGWTIGNRE